MKLSEKNFGRREEDMQKQNANQAKRPINVGFFFFWINGRSFLAIFRHFSSIFAKETEKN